MYHLLYTLDRIFTHLHDALFHGHSVEYGEMAANVYIQGVAGTQVSQLHQKAGRKQQPNWRGVVQNVLDPSFAPVREAMSKMHSPM